MNKVYVVFNEYEDTNSFMLGIYSSFEGAQSAIKEWCYRMRIEGKWISPNYFESDDNGGYYIRTYSVSS